MRAVKRPRGASGAVFAISRMSLRQRRRCRRLLPLLFPVIGWALPATAQQPVVDPSLQVPENFPETVIPEELRAESDRLQAEEDRAEEERRQGLESRSGVPDTPVPRERRAARSLGELHRDERSIERLRVDCRNELTRRDITLFGNGTIRLRQGPWQKQEMFLEELGPKELTTYLKKLLRIRHSDRFSETQSVRVDIDGEWLQRCRMTLEVPGDRPLYFSYSPLETQPLALGQLILMAEELASFTRPSASRSHLRKSYRPERDDLLVHQTTGVTYRVIAATDDGKGVELESTVEPLVVYYQIADLPRLFVEPSDGTALDERPLQGFDVLDLEDQGDGFSSFGRRVETSAVSGSPEDPANADSSGDLDADPGGGRDGRNRR